MLVETDWNSCSGARASISTLKMKPAAAAPWRPRVISGPALRKACSLNMITSTAAAKPPPSAQREVLVSSSLRDRWRRLSACCFARRAKAKRDDQQAQAGAATMPIATADWPLRMLTATSTAKSVRKQDSERISAMNRPKRCWPARKPRAK